MFSMSLDILVNCKMDVPYSRVMISPWPDLLPDIFCLMVRIFCLMLVLLYIYK